MNEQESIIAAPQVLYRGFLHTPFRIGIYIFRGSFRETLIKPHIGYVIRPYLLMCVSNILVKAEASKTEKGHQAGGH